MAEVKTVAVIGAGIMGRGIAHAAALGGYRTILEDLLPNALRKAETEIRANLDQAVELRLTPQGRSVRERAFEFRDELVKKMGLGAADFQRLREELVKLRDNLSDAARPTA